MLHREEMKIVLEALILSPRQTPEPKNCSRAVKTDFVFKWNIESTKWSEFQSEKQKN